MLAATTDEAGDGTPPTAPTMGAASMSMEPWALSTYRIRRKVFKLAGASFHVLDGERPVAFCSQAAFKLREDIRLYTDDSKAHELLAIKARQALDFKAAYDVVDSRSQARVGVLRRRGFASIARDSWEVLDEGERPLGQVEEDSLAMALLRRVLSNLIPQAFHLRGQSGGVVTFRTRFNPFVYSLEVRVPSDVAIDRRLVLAAAILLAAIEGRQD
jgi:hypothetical protein